MLIHSTKTFDSNNNYSSVIKKQFSEAKEVKLLVSYIKDSGFNLLKKELEEIASHQDKNIKIICSLDMDITSPEAIQKLVDIGVEVKHYEMQQGTFHPKIWIFVRDDGYKTCVIGSANLTLAAMRDNVEAGLLVNSEEQEAMVSDAEKFFNYLWNNNDAHNVNSELLHSLIDYRKRKKALLAENNKLLGGLKYDFDKPQIELDKKNAIQIILKFVNHWIQLGVDNQKFERGQNQLWRGWYVMPDHGWIEDTLMDRLKYYCSIISSADNDTLDISVNYSDERFGKILEKYQTTLKRANLKTSLRGLFVRQAKNYLINLNFCYHPVKENGKLISSTLVLSPYGKELANSTGIIEMKKIYTAAIDGRMHLGVPMLKTIKDILAKYETLDFHEFSLFVKHILSKDDIDAAITVIDLYRKLSKDDQNNVVNLATESFDQKLSQKASGVLMNYEKNVKHTMSAFGWCEGLHYDGNILSINSQN